MKKIPEILQRLLGISQRGDLSTLARLSGVPMTTLRRWRDNLRINPTWTPNDTKWGQHLRIFTDTEEEAISNFIQENFIKQHQLFTTEDFRTLVLNAYARKATYCQREFLCTDSFITDFKRRHGFSTKLQHFKRRPSSSPVEQEQWKEWLQNLLKDSDNWDYIINCDETAWKLFPNNILTWWNTGEDDVSIYINGDEKASLTVLATISASGKKWPLFFLGNGKTERVERSQIGDIGDHWKSHSPSGWMTEDTFQTYLRHLRDSIGGDTWIHLICDMHSSHRTNDVKTLANALHIALHYVPAGSTDGLQPLDRVIFGVLKAKAKCLFRRRIAENPFLKRTKLEAVQDMISAWDSLTAAAIESAWEIYDDDFWDNREEDE